MNILLEQVNLRAIGDFHPLKIESLHPESSRFSSFPHLLTPFIQEAKVLMEKTSSR